jgi:hypothetical protein
VPPAPAPVATTLDRARESGEWADQTSQHSGSPAASETSKHVSNLKYQQNQKRNQEFYSPAGRWGASRDPTGTGAAQGPGVDGAPRLCSRVLPQEGALKHPRPHQRDGVRRLRHLEDAEWPLQQGDDPPVVEEGEDSPRGQPAARQVPQRGQKRVQPPLMLDRRHPVAPGVGLLPEHQTGVGGRPDSSLRR